MASCPTRGLPSLTSTPARSYRMALARLALFNYDELHRHDFEPYQAAGVERMLACRKLVVADETGLGKTIQILGMLAAVAESEGFPETFAGRVLVAAPPGLLPMWRAQIERFVPTLTAKVVTPASLQKKSGADVEWPQVELVGYDTLK